ALVPAIIPLHHLPQRRRGDYGASVKLVARAESHRMVEAIEVRPGIRGQSRRGRRPRGASVKQEGNAHDGWHPDYRGAEFHDLVLGSMESTDRIDVARGIGADRPWVLRRLRED